MKIRIILKNLLFSTLILLFNSCINAQDTIEDIMQDYAENRRREIGSPFTGSVLVAKDDKILFTGAYGVKDRETNSPNEINTIFPIGSLTKQFTAMLVMQMREEGTLNLDDTVATYLDYLPKEFANKITIHQLLSHTSGLPHYEGIIKTGLNINDFTSTYYTPKELALLISQVQFTYEPGTTFHYSSLGYMLLGSILENVSGKSFSELLYHRITKPLGLTQTGFASNDFIKNETARGYVFKEDKTVSMIFKKYGGDFKDVPFRNQSNTYSGGGMHSTVNDLFIWSKAVKNYRLISKKSTILMLKPIKQGYAYGWVRNWEDIIERNSRVRLYSHTGSTFGHAAAISMFDDGTTIIFTCNVGKIKAQNITHKLYLAANNLDDIYGIKGYPDRGSLVDFENEGGIDALNAYFQKLSDLCGYEVRPSASSIRHVISLYYEKGKNKKGDSLKNTYFKYYKLSENAINELGYRIVKSNCEKAIEIFKETVTLFPNSSNAWDSLGVLTPIKQE